MIYDTNALSAWADDAPEVLDRVRKDHRRIIPATVLGEYKFGIRGSRYRDEYQLWLDDVLQTCEIAPVTDTTAEIYGRIAHDLKTTGQRIPSNDIWIAACAIELGVPLLSRDTDFDRIVGLVRIGFKEAP